MWSVMRIRRRLRRLPQLPRLLPTPASSFVAIIHLWPKRHIVSFPFCRSIYSFVAIPIISFAPRPQHCLCTVPPVHGDRAGQYTAVAWFQPHLPSCGASEHHHGTRDTKLRLRRLVSSPSCPWSIAARTTTELAAAAVRRRIQSLPFVSNTGEHSYELHISSSLRSALHPSL
jgi:hypothetical protein